MKEEILKLELKIDAFDDNKTEKDELSKHSNLEDNKRLTILESRLAGLESEQRVLSANSSAIFPQGNT